jgi:nucleoredoxin
VNNVAPILLLQVVVLVVAGAYLHQKNPVGFARVVDDIEQLVSSAISGTPSPAEPGTSPGGTGLTGNNQAPAAPETVPATGNETGPTAVNPVPAAPVPAAPVSQPFVPPTVMPSFPNWTWTTIAGRVYTNVKVLSVDSNSVLITYDGGGERVPLAYLRPDLRKVFNYTAPTAAPAVSPAMSAPVSPAMSPAASPATTAGAGNNSAVSSMVFGNLVRNGTNGLLPVNDSALTPVRYFAVYYSAQWCPPCHVFTPKLVQFYNTFKATHPDFEVIFVSEDHDENQMHDYMETMAMPWPAVRYDKLSHPTATFKGSGIESYANSGIPDLVLLDSTGKVLSDSFRNGTYVGADTVMADIPTLVK